MLADTMIAAVRINGKFIRVRVGPHETEERAMARAWWIGTTATVQDKPPAERECLSMIWANEKFDNMKYNIFNK